MADALRDLPCKLIIIGSLSPEQRDRLEHCAIHYVSHTNLTEKDLIEQYVSADILIFASLYEGFGMPILEAQATGRPVITSNLYSMPEVAGGAACLVDPYDVGAIRAAVLRLCQDDAYREQLVAAGLENVKRFDPATIAGQYAAVYDSLQTGVEPQSNG